MTAQRSGPCAGRVRVGQTALRCRKSVIILSVTSEALSSGIVMVGREQDDVVLDRKNIEARKANMAEDYGLKSFNGIIFALLGIMALAVAWNSVLSLQETNHGRANEIPC